MTFGTALNRTTSFVERGRVRREFWAPCKSDRPIESRQPQGNLRPTCAIRRWAVGPPRILPEIPQRTHWSRLLSTPQNRLIELLPGRDRQRLLSLADLVRLTQSDVLGEIGKATRFVYFPVDGFISLITAIESKPVLEVGMVGREGMFGVQAASGVLTQPLHALVQGPGSAQRIGLSAFSRELQRGAALRRILGRYSYVLMSQLASSAACIRFHSIDARLGRRLLMMQDRAHADSFGGTHEFMAHMLGVRRVSITDAAGVMQRNGLIEYHRGQVTVLDREGLEAATCTCYTAERQAYSRVMH